MGQRIKQITIVGGGTAGWLSALLLSRYFKQRADDPETRRITLIESPNVRTIGVGEATVPAMPQLLKRSGVPEREFFKRCNASFKLGVYFDNWNHDKDGQRIGYFNSFIRPPMIAGLDAAHHFLRHGAEGRDFAESFSPGAALVRACKGPRPLNAKPYEDGVGFAYHLDAGHFAELLRDVCLAQGVEHVRDDVVDVEKTEDGYIAALMLKEQGRLPVELVIDCTGFRGVLVNGALGEPFIDYSKYLANNRAAAVQIPHTDPRKIEPVTRSTALGAGWVWRVPLHNRVGTGYVFSSAHRSDEEACEELLAHLRETAGEAAKDATPRIIPIRVGRTRNPWVKNCVAIGLSGGFIEPLESTAIFMIEMSVRWLLDYFPDKDFAEPLRARFNKVATQLYDEVRDFICLHYALGNRSDSQYWIDAREALEVPDSLAENLELWKHALPTPNDLTSQSLFSYHVFHAVMLGKQVYDTGFADAPYSTATLDREQWMQRLAKMQQVIDRTVQSLPDHRQLLDTIRGELEEPPAPPQGARFSAPAPPATVAIPGYGTPIKPVIVNKPKTAVNK